MWDGDVGTGGITSNKDCQTCHEKNSYYKSFLKYTRYINKENSREITLERENNDLSRHQRL